MFVLSFVYSSVNKSQLGIVCAESSPMSQLTPPEISKQDAVLRDIYAVNVYQNLPMIQKELESSNDDYKVTAARKHHFGHSDENMLLFFWDEKNFPQDQMLNSQNSLTLFPQDESK